MRSRLLGSIFALLGAVLLSAKAADLPPEVRIGLQDNLGPDFLIESFAPTMRLLRGEHPETRFKTTIYTPEELSRAVRERRVDAFFADSALFGVLQLESGAQQIAARTAPYVEDPSKAAGIAVVVRRGSPIRTLSDVPGKRIAFRDPGGLFHVACISRASQRNRRARAGLGRRGAFHGLHAARSDPACSAGGG